MLDVTTGSAGDMGAAFEDYTTSGMRALIESTFSKTPFLQPVPVAVRDAAAAHPAATSSCSPS